MLTKFKLYSCNIYFKYISYCRCLGDRDGLILRFLLTSILAARDLLKPKRTWYILGLLHNFLSPDHYTDNKSHYSL